MKKIACFVCVLLVGAVALSLNGSAVAKSSSSGDLRYRLSDVAEQALPAVVSIRVGKRVAVRRFNPFSPQRSVPHEEWTRGQGSGFLISADGYILTNNHVVNGADEIMVRLRDGREYKAELIGTDPKSEVALIQIDGEDLPFLEAGSSDELRIAERVLAIGNPYGLRESVTSGIISAIGRKNMGITDYENFIQTDAAINPGNSGGPLLNAEGEVIGINTAILSRSGGSSGVGLAIPIGMAMDIKKQLLDSGHVSRGYLGVYIQEVTEKLAGHFGLDESKGVLIVDLKPGSAAAEGGLQAGDIVLELNGAPVDAVTGFRNRIANLGPDAKAEMKLLREGKTVRLEVVTRELGGSDSSRGAELLSEIGLSVENRISDARGDLSSQSDSGVVVREVEPGSQAWRVGLRKGVVIVEANHQLLENVEQFRRVLSGAQSSGGLLLLVRNGRVAHYISLDLE